MSEFEKLYESFMDSIKKRSKPRYNGTNLNDVRGLRQGNSTKHRLFNLYKRSLNRGNSINSGVGMLNKSRKSLRRIAMHRGLDTILKRGDDGKRMTRRVGKRVNSKTNTIVKRVLANGNVVVGQPTLTNFKRD